MKFFWLDETLHALASEKVANDLLVEEEMDKQARYRQMEQQLATEHDDRLVVEEELNSAKVCIYEDLNICIA